MSKYIEEIKKIDLKYLGALALGILAPFIYMWIRIYWIADNGSGAIATTSFQSYMQMFMEIFSAFLLIPLLTYKKDEYKRQSLTILTSVSFVLLISIFIGEGISMAMVKSVHSINPSESISNIKIYLFFMTLSTIFIVFEQFLVTEIIVDKNTNKAIVLALISIVSKVIIDILFLSNISPFEFSIILVSISSFISTLMVVTVLLIIYIISLIKDKEKSKNIVLKDVMAYYYRGMVPAIELTIRNLSYSFVTLKIVLMLGESDWNAWNMGGYIYWIIIFKITSVLEIHLLSEMINEDREHTSLLARIYLLINMLTIIILGLILSNLYLPGAIGKEDWSDKAVMLSMANIPIMMIIGTQNIIKQRIISDNKYWYLLSATIFNTIVLYVPLIIMIYWISITFGFWANYIVFGVSCLIPTVINGIQYIWIEKRRGETNG